jgi:hypothetical protein
MTFPGPDDGIKKKVRVDVEIPMRPRCKNAIHMNFRGVI